MPKTKTNSSTKKRIKINGHGKLLCKQANMRHNLRKKTKKQKRHLRSMTLISKSDRPRMLRLLSPSKN